MFLRFHEPESQEYVYIDENGAIRLIMPVMSGSRIGTNHLSHLVDSLKRFLDPRNRDPKASAIGILRAHKEKIAIDLKYLPEDAPETVAKLKRLEQIDIYLKLVEIIRRDLRDSLGGCPCPIFPGVLTTLMENSNLRIILLRPWQINLPIRIPVTTYCFSLRNNRLPSSEVCANIINELHPIYERYYSEKSLEQGMEMASSSLFESARKETDLIILTEFFLALLNVACRDQNLSEANFGIVLDSNRQLTRYLAGVVVTALKKHQSVEEALLKAICENKRFFGISNWLNDYSLAKFKGDFITLFQQIQDSPQFDQFMLLSETKRGDFFVHHGSISISFARVMLQDYYNEKLNAEQKAFVAEAEATFDTVSRDGNILPDTHADIHAARQGVQLDISKLSHADLQALYEDICSYTDQEIKREALHQLHTERPDFQPKLDFAAFLQHVAYGQQDQAEEMLQKYQNFTQQLLRLETIPFTDRAGRTFTCTAYEYAMRVKDGHMLRMLERYIVQDIETTRIIHSRAEDLLHPELRYNAAFFGRLKNDAWHYTTDNNGQVDDHYEQFVGIAPLLRALEKLTDKIHERNTRPEGYTREENLELDRIWVEEVGSAQRMLPEHMIQEYSQSGVERGFAQLLQKPQLLDSAVPNNLRRSPGDENRRLWISQDLGSVYAIARGSRDTPYGLVFAPDLFQMGSETKAILEYQAIKLIDQIRTQDVYDSFNRLRNLLPKNNETACPRLY